MLDQVGVSFDFHSFLYTRSKTARVNMESCYGGISTRLKRRAVTENGDQFLFNIITGDESCIHPFYPEETRLSMQYRHTSSPRPKKKMPSACKILLTFLGLTKSLHDRIFGSWDYCQFSSVH